MCFGNHELSLTIATIFGLLALGLLIYYRKKLKDGGADAETMSMQMKKLMEFKNISNPLTPLPHYIISLGFFIHALYGQFMCS